MNYQTFQPHPDLAAVVKCYWTLEVPAEAGAEKQRILPDGCIEMIFILGDDVKRFTSETDFIVQPRAMVLGQINDPFFIQPTGYVNTFAVRFYLYGFANFVTAPVKDLSDKETAIALLFGDAPSARLQQEITAANNTQERIAIAENFLLSRLNNRSTIDNIVKTTVDALVLTGGNSSIRSLLQDDPSKRRQLERNFSRQIGLSPKQLGKVIRLQAALKMLLGRENEKLTHIAYENDYYDQAHFIKDFKEFTGTTPTEFTGHATMVLSSLIYKNDRV
jgi:AraC-like DNA-binding protein